MGYITVDTQNARYIVELGVHNARETQLFPAADAFVVETASNHDPENEPQYKQLNTFSTMYGYSELVKHAKESNKPIFDGDVNPTTFESLKTYSPQFLFHFTLAFAAFNLLAFVGWCVGCDSRHLPIVGQFSHWKCFYFANALGLHGTQASHHYAD